MALFYIHQGSGPCFWKCKIHVFVAVLEFSVREIIFFQFRLRTVLTQRNSQKQPENYRNTGFLRADDAK